VSVAVATAEDLEALRTELARLAAEVAELRADRSSRETLSPKEIAKHFNIGAAVVYAACKSGALVAECRRKRGGIGYLITLEAARAWRAAVGTTNQ
jgi:hypothetical protein